MSIATNEQAAVDAAPKQLLIGGEWRDASGGSTLAVEDPSTGEPFCEVADATPDDAKAALDAACAAQAEWAATPPNERSEILHRAFLELNERADELAILMTLEMGKAVAESKAELAYAAEFFRWFAGEALRIDGYFKTAGNNLSRVLVMRQPVGPCYFITPWNFPNAMGTRKIGPAIAAGCTMVVKPAQQTPLSMLALAKLLEECGLPPGVLNVITSKSSAGVSEPIISDPRLRKLSFTGSTEVGRKLIAQAAEGVLKVSMELGGNAPFLIFDDADLDTALEGAMIAKMRNVGEACTSANRFHVAESRADEFAEKLAQRMGAMKVGRGTEEGVEVGPLIDDADLDAALEGAMIAKMRNVGEACTSANRFHVAESRADEFAEKLAQRMGRMRVGRGTEEGVEVGPLIDDAQRSKVAELVDDAVGKGADAVVGGSRRDGAGYFYDPTVLSGVTADARVLTEEIFGPVAPVASFGSEEEAVAAANDTEYGLVAYVFTSNLKRAFRVCEGLETGMIGLNQGMVSNAGAPFGGVKQSGVGREGGNEGIHEFLETKYIAVNV